MQSAGVYNKVILSVNCSRAMFITSIFINTFLLVKMKDKVINSQLSPFSPFFSLYLVDPSILGFGRGRPGSGTLGRSEKKEGGMVLFENIIFYGSERKILRDQNQRGHSMKGTEDGKRFARSEYPLLDGRITEAIHLQSLINEIRQESCPKP